MKSRSMYLAATAAAALTLCSPALRAEGPVPGGNTEEIQALRTRLDQLEVQQKLADQQRQEAERKLEEKIASDKLSGEAARHDQFISAEGFTAGYNDNRFTIGSADGNFTLRPWYHLQVRETTIDRNDYQGNTQRGIHDEWDSGSEIRRMKIGLDGNMFGPDFTYFFNWATSRTSSNATVKNGTTTVGTVSNGLGGVPILEEAWVRYQIPTTPFFIRAGQIKDPVLHDQIVSSRYQQSAERSLTADYFTNGDAFTQGVTLIYDPNSFIRTEAGVNHGMRSANTNFFSYPDNGSFNQYNFGVAGRVEYKVMGRWKDYAQIGAVGTTEPLLVFGLGGDCSQRGHANQLVAAADAMYGDPSGLNFYSAFVDRYTDHNFGAYTVSATGASLVTPSAAVLNKPTNEYSILFQAGYLIGQHLEPFGRYEVMHLLGTPSGSRTNIQVITAGANYYFHGHRLKLTTEILWLPNGTPLDDNGGDILVGATGKSEVSFVTQLQLLL